MNTSIKINDRFPFLGVGICYKEHYIDKILKNIKYIDCFEVKPEHYFGDIKETVEEVQILAEKFPVIAHGLFLSIGSFEGLSKTHVNNLNKFFRHAPKIPFMGEHMGCTRAGRSKIPHFINIPYTGETVKIISANIMAARKAVSVPLVYENIPAEFMYPESTLSEQEFFAELVKRTNCGLLLDVTNLYANCYNFGWSVEEYLKQYPVENIVQIHFNGGEIRNGRYIDSHSKPTPPEVWAIFEEVLARRAPVKAVILERDDDADLDELVGDLAKAKKLMRKYKYATN